MKTVEQSKSSVVREGNPGGC